MLTSNFVYLKKYTKKFRQEAAHEDGIWCCAWGTFEKDHSEVIVTGSVDDKVKIWTWSREKLDLKYTCEGHQLGVVSVDINKAGSNILFKQTIQTKNIIS